MSPDAANAFAASLSSPGQLKRHVQDHLLVKDETGMRVSPPWAPGTLVMESFDQEGPLGLIVCVDGDDYLVLWSEDVPP